MRAVTLFKDLVLKVAKILELREEILKEIGTLIKILRGRVEQLMRKIEELQAEERELHFLWEIRRELEDLNSYIGYRYHNPGSLARMIRKELRKYISYLKERDHICKRIHEAMKRAEERASEKDLKAPDHVTENVRKIAEELSQELAKIVICGAKSPHKPSVVMRITAINVLIACAAVLIGRLSVAYPASYTIYVKDIFELIENSAIIRDRLKRYYIHDFVMMSPVDLEILLALLNGIADEVLRSCRLTYHIIMEIKREIKPIFLLKSL